MNTYGGVETAPNTNWIGSCVDPRVRLDAVKKRKILPSLGLESGTYVSRRYSEYTAKPRLVCVVHSKLHGEPATEHLRLAIHRGIQSRAEQRSSLLPVTPGIKPRLDPWPYICSMSRLLFFFFHFFRCSSFDGNGGVGVPLLHLFHPRSQRQAHRLV
jgi:hypothetical protein